MAIDSKAWREGNESKTTNINSVFRDARLWNFSFPTMQPRLNLFKDGGVALSEMNPTWMRCW